MDKKTKHGAWLTLEGGAAVTCVATLFIAAGHPWWVIVLIGICGEVAILGLIYHLGGFRAPIPIGAPVRAFIIIAAVSAFMILLCWMAWPRVRIYPSRVSFSGVERGDTYSFRLSNDTPEDQYAILATFNISPSSAHGLDFAIDMPNAKLLSSKLGLFTDSIILDCTSWTNKPIVILQVRQLQPHESRVITFKRIVEQNVTIEAKIEDYSDQAQSYIEERHGTTGEMELSNRLNVNKSCKAYGIHPSSRREGP